MEFATWLKETTYGTLVRDSLWVYPFFEIVHLMGLALLVGSIAMTDLRLIGLSRQLPVTLTAKHLLPWTWVGFALIVVSGLSLFAGFATDYYVNTAFRIKVVLIAVAGVNAFLFHMRVYKNVASWDADTAPPFAAKAFAVVSITLWFSIIAAGRLIAYTGAGKD